MRYQHTYEYANNNHPGLRGLTFSSKIEEMVWYEAIEAKMWDRLLMYKWDRVAQEQSGESMFDHSNE